MMDWIFRGLVGIALAFVVAVIYLAAIDDSPSCEDRGGKTTFSHFMPIFNGKTTSLIPQYNCQMPAQ